MQLCRPLTIAVNIDLSSVPYMQLVDVYVGNHYIPDFLAPVLQFLCSSFPFTELDSQIGTHGATVFEFASCFTFHHGCETVKFVCNY